MRYIEFVRELEDARNAESVYDYIASKDNLSENLCQKIYNIVSAPTFIKGIKSLCGVTNLFISKYYGIYIRQVEGWSASNAKVHDYVFELIAYIEANRAGILDDLKGAMPFCDFSIAVDNAMAYSKKEDYIASYEKGEWALSYTPDQLYMLRLYIWNLITSPTYAKGIKSAGHRTTKYMSENYNIKVRTLEEWCRGSVKCLTYVWKMIAYLEFIELGIIKKAG